MAESEEQFVADGSPVTCSHCGLVIEAGERVYVAALGTAHVTCDEYAGSDDDEVDDDDHAYGANYLADDCTMRCGLCDARVNDDGLCPHCDNASEASNG